MIDGALFMSLLNEDLKAINLQFLMLARECSKINPMEAMWRFNLSDKEIKNLSSLSLDELKTLSDCGKAIFRIPVTQTPTGVTSSIAAALIHIPRSNQEYEHD
ncbi:MAG: flagellar transcriptional regulator FlhD [Methylicorpusculum sp.]|uniref:flagellar transcriptional regulator FlhD n=2 Tax=Methylicorpusculum sp. TaxID=2713644 RepID=UPI0027322BC1|nr:flagellar transcriptional regulator FlhD [Methylicorpusculum sp.]MDP3531322.1 flagellar transcriptional regulator FlhD [Methylicorpusculum sp.]